MRFSVRRSDGVKSNTASKVGGAVCVLVAAFFAVLAGLSCSTEQIAGLDDTYKQPNCSTGCGYYIHIYFFITLTSIFLAFTFLNATLASSVGGNTDKSVDIYTECLKRNYIFDQLAA